MVEFIVGLMKVYAGGSPHYDEDALRALAKQDVARTGNIASCLTSHFVIDFSEPVRLTRSTRPPWWCRGAGSGVRARPRAGLRRPGAELLVLEKTGHELPPPVWGVFVPALVRHTAG